ncbi:hypothetical protein DIE04_09300 [Burkholderia sp. Bp8994]|nr:hypothetical protein DIE20_13355 [Burkholderia sp. Bp9131]RQR72463.1 hypothetical protein DIE12_15920 [Burkholderia sp. Bp9015]RQR98841.1 hypothetical protein DIE04_09300 [Burkholderia sp. Bp8994]RQS42556.1 hypothetical protein DIE01_09000 [Burkholderia sp. Bp8990]RQS59559.1 hypothetical protein DID99_03300 [Burkholderia sp. Bp8986]RQS61420.1 hypothetical protein DID98_11125 [Burkholderia sp. Bp8984]RQZ39834.1 hypothetical protein DIE16_10245 [Burkholderia sp. Bp9090]RQZ50482.1 hypothetic
MPRSFCGDSDAGHLYLAQIRHVIEEIDRVEETIASMHHEPNNIGLIRNWALAGMGIAVLPDFLAAPDLAAGRLRELLADYRLEELEMNVVYPSRRHFPRNARLFIDHLIDHFVR